MISLRNDFAQWSRSRCPESGLLTHPFKTLRGPWIARWNRSKVKFRIPEKNISKENPFPEGTELFAMPNGWQLFDQWQPCSFHSVQLTKIDGSAYWASFFNYFYQKENKYYPTSLVLISRKVSDKKITRNTALFYEHTISKSGSPT